MAFIIYPTVEFFFIFILLFIYLFLAVLGLCCCGQAFSSCGERGPLFIAVRGPLTVVASLVAEHRLQTRRLSSCRSWAQLLRGTWDLPRPGLKPASPALAGRLSTTAPPLSTVFSTCYHWWTCLLVCLLSSFSHFLNYFLNFLKNFLIFYFNNFILFYFSFCFFLFFPLFSSELCDWQGLGALADCQAWASEVGELISGHWTTRDLQVPCNINWQQLSQRSPPQC